MVTLGYQHACRCPHVWCHGGVCNVPGSIRCGRDRFWRAYRLAVRRIVAGSGAEYRFWPLRHPAGPGGSCLAGVHECAGGRAVRPGTWDQRRVSGACLGRHRDRVHRRGGSVNSDQPGNIPSAAAATGACGVPRAYLRHRADSGHCAPGSPRQQYIRSSARICLGRFASRWCRPLLGTGRGKGHGSHRFNHDPGSWPPTARSA